MNFFKQVLATIVGMFIFQIIGLIIFAIFFTVLLGSLQSMGEDMKSSKAEIKDNSVLKLDINYEMTEKDGYTQFSAMDFQSFPKEKAGLQSVLRAINNAKDDDRIKGIYIQSSIMPNAYATVELIRNALLDFKESGKFVVAYGEVLDQKSYYLATVADKIYVNPEGHIELRGVGAQLTFYKKLLEEKLEAEVQVFKVGDYKSAVEPFIKDKMSDANREQLEYLLGGIKEDFISNIATARALEKDKVNWAIDNLIASDPDSSVFYHLIDATKYQDEVAAELKTLAGLDEEDDLEFADINNYAFATTKVKQSRDKIAVLYAEGEIVDGEGDDTNIGSQKFAKEIKELREDEDVDAVVLRVNSPGGSALASEVIWRELALTKEVKPVVVSMGDVAASGGYYISCNADKIFAQDNTITGSIGVFGMIPNLEKFLNNKLGITFDEVKLNEHAVSNGVTKKFDPFEAKVIQNGVDKVYATFTGRVAEGRGMDINNVLSIAGGRVWTGEQAKDRGLVDEIGGLDDAIAFAAEKARISDYRINEYPKSKTPFEAILDDLGMAAKTCVLEKELSVFYPYYKDIKHLGLLQGQVQMALPYRLEIY